jgi:hypothetical protein
MKVIATIVTGIVLLTACGTPCPQGQERECHTQTVLVYAYGGGMHPATITSCECKETSK